MLAAQMAAVHNATMIFARRLNHVDNIPQQDSAERAFNKLARTFASQLEALKRYRSAGEQTVRVEHVTVNEGGQAIVGLEHNNTDGLDHRGFNRGPAFGRPHRTCRLARYHRFMARGWFSLASSAMSILR